MRGLFGLMCIFSVCSVHQGWAQAPEPFTMNYQGQLTDLTRQPIEGERDITFRLYSTAEGGDAIWEEDHVGVQCGTCRWTPRTHGGMGP